MPQPVFSRSGGEMRTVLQMIQQVLTKSHYQGQMSATALFKQSKLPSEYLARQDKDVVTDP